LIKLSELNVSSTTKEVNSYHPATKRITTYNTAAGAAFFNDESGDGLRQLQVEDMATNKVLFGHIFKMCQLEVHFAIYQELIKILARGIENRIFGPDVLIIHRQLIIATKGS
jgi:hypothetical protein